MPPNATMRYWADDPTTKDQRELAEAAENERRLRAEIYRLASDQYDGKHKHFLKKREGAVDPNVVINRDGEAIDSILALAFAALPDFELNETEQTPDETWLREAWEYNGGVTLLNDWGLFGSLTGHCFGRVMEAGEDDEYPQVIALHPTAVLIGDNLVSGHGLLDRLPSPTPFATRDWPNSPTIAAQLHRPAIEAKLREREGMGLSKQPPVVATFKNRSPNRALIRS